MKKLLNVVFSLFVFLCSCFGNSVFARSYVIDDYHTDIKINEDGSCNFTDRFTYRFDGKFNGIYFNIDYAGCGDFEDYSVSIIEDGQEKVLQSSNSGTPYTYESNFKNRIAKFKIYAPADSETKVFLFRYKLSKAIQKFADTAQFNRKLVPKGFETQINNFNGEISFQHEAKSDDLRIFAHGPLYGESKINDNGTVSLMISDLPEKTFVEANLLFPIEYVPNMKVTSNKNKLESILKKEKKLAEKSNAIRDKVRDDLRNQSNKISFNEIAVKGYIVSFAVFVVLAVIFSAKTRMEYYTEHFEGDYYRELPADYSPAEMSMLVNCSISDNDMTATLLDLFRRKIILIEPTGAKGGLFKKDDHKITKLKNFENDTSVNKHEKFLLNFLLNEIGNSEYVYISDIKKFAKLHYEKFEGQYNEWKQMINNIADERGFFRKQKFPAGWFTGCGLFVFIALFVLLIFKLKNDAAVELITLLISCFVFTLIACILFLTSPLCNMKREKSKQVEYEKWLAFKKFLKDFSNLDSASVGSIVMWEHYLVYAVALGVAKYVIKQLPLVFKNYDFKSNGDLVLLSYAYSDGFDVFGPQLHSAHRAAAAARSKAEAIARSKNSSTTGKGGGFSIGSSRGSGGKGGGGAF